MAHLLGGRSTVGELRGLVHVGSAALNALRMEKTSKSGHEITNEVTLAEAGLTRFYRIDGFRGAAASLARPEKRALVHLRPDEPEQERPDADPLGSESLWRDGRPVGSVALGAFGYAANVWLGWAYGRPDLAAPGTELDVMALGRPRRAEVLGEAVFDPGNDRPRM